MAGLSILPEPRPLNLLHAYVFLIADQVKFNRAGVHYFLRPFLLEEESQNGIQTFLFIILFAALAFYPRVHVDDFRNAGG